MNSAIIAAKFAVVENILLVPVPLPGVVCARADSITKLCPPDINPIIPRLIPATIPISVFLCVSIIVLYQILAIFTMDQPIANKYGSE